MSKTWLCPVESPLGGRWLSHPVTTSQGVTLRQGWWRGGLYGREGVHLGQSSYVK